MINALKKLGVEEVIFCSGSHNATLLPALLENFKVRGHFDERGAAFYALGRIKATSKPTVVVTTSGTAVAECLPAVIEAHFSGLPLIIISADRPKRFVGTGAPQVIDQSGILSPYAVSYAIEGSGTVSFLEDKPSHWNFFLDEEPPEISLEIKTKAEVCINASINDWLESVKSPLVIVEQVPKNLLPRVIEFLRVLKAPVLAEARSGLFGSLPELIVTEPLDFHDSVLRIGSVPVTSYWRQLSNNNLKIASLAYPYFSGTDREQLLLPLCEKTLEIPSVSFGFKNAEIKRESNQISEIVSALPKDSKLYFGNSLPIREAIKADLSGFHVEGNRGANGIDGQIATFAGFIKGTGGYGFIGDLTFLYDLPSLSLLQGEEFKLFVINNKGGRIFEGLERFNKLSKLAKDIIINEPNVDLNSIISGFGLERKVVAI